MRVLVTGHQGYVGVVMTAVLKEAGHMTLDEQPEKAVKLITAFLNGKKNEEKK